MTLIDVGPPPFTSNPQMIRSAEKERGGGGGLKKGKGKKGKKGKKKFKSKK